MNDRNGAASDPTRGSSAVVADYLRQEILDGRLVPGQRIRQEAVANSTGASRLPVREALRTLEGEGLVVLEPNRGARVTALDLHECDMLYSSRARIEPLVLADSVERISEETIVRLGEILDQIEAGVDLVDFLLLDRDFHLLSYSGCESGQLLSIVERLWNSTQQYRRAFSSRTGPQWLEDTNLEHRLLLRAIEARDGEVAGGIIATHITRTRRALHRKPDIFATETPA